MFLHQYPYPPFIPKNAKKLIVGTLPPPRFLTGDLHEKDVDFCYGSYHNSLWKKIDAIHNLGFRYNNSKVAVEERKAFLVKNNIGICDIVESAERDKINASDLGMTNIKLRDVVSYINKFPNIETILFTGGNSKNGPEYLFKKHLRGYGLNLEIISKDIPRIHQFKINHRLVKTVLLTSGSGAANIAISQMPLYKQLKAKDPNFNTFDFRVQQYREFL